MEFVTRTSSALRLGTREFRFAGTNLYYAQPHVAYGEVDKIREVLDEMTLLGLLVARTIGFNDGSPADSATIQTARGVFREAGLVALDRVVAEARLRNIRLILYFTNNWEAYGGINRYVTWLLGRTPVESERSLFLELEKTQENFTEWQFSVSKRAFMSEHTK
jgi:mannan endo-1,4-beta-mannosidase